MTTTLLSTQTSTARPATTAAARRLLRPGLVAGIAAAAANFAVYAAARLADVSLEIQDEAIPAFGFPQLTLIAAVFGIGMAAMFRRRSHRPRRAFVRSTVGLTALSMLPPVLAAADTATKVVLGLTHLVAAVIIIPVIATRLAD
jgi:hypothetical protein